jgi:2-hydroxychromene-2-carboxylate isomerase
MDLRAVMPASGAVPVAGRSQMRLDYFFGREIHRWAEYRSLDIMKKMPTYHDRSIHLSNCLLIAADEAGADVDRLSREILRAHWVHDADVSSCTDLSRICERIGLAAGPLLARAESSAVKRTYAANTQEAIDRSVFGSPTYFVGGDMFYGQDRLELVERALDTPFAGKWPLR